LTEQTTAAKAFTGELSQAETNYVPLSAVQGKACASCRWFMAYGDCYIVEDEPEPILATGYCDRHEATPEPEPAQDVAEVIAEALGEVLEDQAETIATSIYASPMWAERARKAFKSVFARLIPQKAQSDLVVIKGKDGKNYWLATFTNNFKDLENEILSESAHKDFEQRLDMGLTPMPELWAWHTEGTKHGQADAVWYQDHNMYAIGHFDDTPEATKAISYYRSNPIKLSHGFVTPEWAFKDGVYEAYNTFEISTLPPSVAANPYTSFEEIKAMPVPEKREAFITELFGDKAPEVLAKVNARTEASKELESLVEFKDFSSTIVKSTTETTETTKALGSLYGEVVEGQTELIGFVKTLVTKLQEKDTEIKTVKSAADTQIAQLQESIKELRTIVNAPPQRASQADSTVNKDETLKDKTPKGDPLSNFFGVPMKAESN
jgi:hypothetical protein